MKKKLLVILTIVAALILFFYFQNNSIVTNEISISSKKIPQSFDGYKIVQLSDLHSKSFGDVLVEKVQKINPDIIVFTGDLVDSKKYDEQTSLALMKNLVEVAPVYYVTGNHEWWSGEYENLESKLIDTGVYVLRNTAEDITINNDTIQIFGVDDPAKANIGYAEQSILEEDIQNTITRLEKDRFSILLSHRPEMFYLYAQYEFDLVFSGHAHGGQVRIPFVGGLVAPNQGFFPKYTEGAHTSDGTTMVVNRGLGNSIIPLRIFNRPEIIAVTLHKDN